MKNILTIALFSLIVTSCATSATTTAGAKPKTTSRNQTVQSLIDNQNTSVNTVGVESKEVSKGVYEIDTTAPQGTVLSAAHDMFQKQAFKLCGGDNYTYSIKSQENVSFSEFVGREKKMMNMPTVKGTAYCNTRTAGAAKTAM